MPLDSTNWPQTTEVIDETTALLIRARGFIERGWCKNADARAANGMAVAPCDSRAIAWCVYGALVAGGMSPLHSGTHKPSAYVRFSAAIDNRLVGIFNDRQETVEPVLAAFDRAIAAGNPGRPGGGLSDAARRYELADHRGR